MASSTNSSLYSSLGYSTASSNSSISSLVVAAIDFGTAYSGCAFAFKNDPSQIETSVWENKTASAKTSTSILFEKGRFHSFGHKADTKYNEILEEIEGTGDSSTLKDWHYFRKFKMTLYQELGQLDPGMPIGRQRKRKISKQMVLKDENGNKMNAFKIFTEAIRYMKKELLAKIQERVPEITLNDLKWILTVPAIWADAAKQFMREAATEAGIPDGCLQLALEPEAAAIHCKQVAVQKSKSDDGITLSPLLPGQQFLILDMGGGTVDITVIEILDHSRLKEIWPPSGGPWGGEKVDEAHRKFLKDLFSKRVWDDICRENPLCIFEIGQEFEIKKRNIDRDNDLTTVKYPTCLFEKYFELKSRKMSDELKQDGNRYKNIVTAVKDKLKIKTSFILEKLFGEPKEQIIQHLKRLFKEPCMSSVNTIMVVGGFAESEFMKSEIKKAFSDKRLIIPKEPNTAVLKGAVMFGFDPLVICERKSPRTYGICVKVPFDPKKHKEAFKSCHEGIEECENIFRVMVSKGQSLVIGEAFDLVCRPTFAQDTRATVEIYSSTEEKPKYTTDDSCKRIGEITLDIPDVSKGKNRLIKVRMYFGGTEIYVQAQEEGTSNEVIAKFDCLYATLHTLVDTITEVAI